MLSWWRMRHLVAGVGDWGRLRLVRRLVSLKYPDGRPPKPSRGTSRVRRRGRGAVVGVDESVEMEE